jgi:hypothetical protein
MSTRHLYPLGKLYPDYGLAGLGLVLAVPCLSLEPGPYFGAILGGVIVLCLVALAYTWNRQRTVVTLDAEQVVVQAFDTKTIEWKDLTAINLAFFSRKGDKTDGWMQLTLEAGDKRVKIDSRIEDFIAIVRQTARAVGEKKLAINGLTRANLHALGIYIY